MEVTYKDNVIPMTTKAKQYRDAASQEFIKWLDNALVGDKYCYHIGYHVAGASVGRVAMDAYIDGRVTLYQQRFEDKFRYIAQKIRWE